MSQRTFITVAGVVFSVIAVAHELRLLCGWTAVINGWAVPYGVSWIAVIVFGALAYLAFQMRRSKR